jgi:hypothetical protein
MSRENLIHTLRDALEALTQMVRNEDPDIRVPEIDEEILAWAEVRPRRTQGPPLYW